MNNKVLDATKWSFVTEMVSKLIAPITNMILARLLVPEMFGIVTTITMVISFADIFSDAGFQKYLIQHEFDDREQLYESSNVAFTVNLLLSIIFWIIIIIFCQPIVKMLGNEGEELVLIISCISLPMTSFSSIQMALYRRNFEFKKLFYVRLIGSCIPLIITVPLAWITRNYWSLIIGTIFGNFANAIVLTLMSPWKPKFKFNFSLLKEMFSFSMWALLEAIIIWFTSYVDIFIIGTILSSYYIGIYKISMTTINQILALITGTTNAVLFTSLSREQNNPEQFRKVFLNFQSFTSYIVIPMGVGIFAYKEFVTFILLGDQWDIASGFIGLWGIVGGFYVILGGYCTEAYRAKGEPKISALVQFIYIIVIIFTIEFSKNLPFEMIYSSRTLSRVLFILIHLVVINKICNISPFDMFKNIYIPACGSLVMYFVSLLLRNFSNNIIWNFISILICIIVYSLFLLMIPKSRKEILLYIKNLKIEVSNK